MSLREIKNVRQEVNGPKRRWFGSKAADVIVWFNAHDSIIGFQFCYDKEAVEQALTWQQGKGFSHMSVDDGEQGGMSYKATPVLRPSSLTDAKRALDAFKKVGDSLPEPIREFIGKLIEERCIRVNGSPHFPSMNGGPKGRPT